jgi:hypothetical protein
MRWSCRGHFMTRPRDRVAPVQPSPRQILLVKSKTRRKAVLHTTFETKETTEYPS